jgi:hypothetical protein
MCELNALKIEMFNFLNKLLIESFKNAPKTPFSNTLFFMIKVFIIFVLLRMLLSAISNV